MRLRSVLSEALRNIGAGVSHALLMFAAVLFASTLLGGYEAANVVGLETEAVQRINAYADVGAIVGGTVDGAACDRLADAGGGVMAPWPVRCVPVNRLCRLPRPARIYRRMK